MSYEYYITPTQYDIGLANGIPKSILSQRVRSSGWDIKRAYTEPIVHYMKDNINDETLKILKSNGISKETFMKRILVLGWNKERALNTIPMNKQQAMKKARESQRKISLADYAKAAEIGVRESTVRSRINNSRWSLEKAVTTPLMTNSQSGKSSRMYQDMYCEINKIKRGN